MQFEYLQTITAQESIEVSDIGNVCLQCWTPYAETKVLIIKTTDGVTEIIDFGYINTDVEGLPDFVNYTYNRMMFSQSKIAKIINKFINDKQVSQVFEITQEEAKNIVKNLVDYVIPDSSTNEIDYDKLI